MAALDQPGMPGTYKDRLDTVMRAADAYAATLAGLTARDLFRPDRRMMPGKPAGKAL